MRKDGVRVLHREFKLLLYLCPAQLLQQTVEHSRNVIISATCVAS